MGTTFLPDWQPPLIFVQFTLKSHEYYLATLLEHMHKKFEIKRTKIKGSCQSGIKVVTHDSKSDLPLAINIYCFEKSEQTIMDSHT